MISSRKEALALCQEIKDKLKYHKKEALGIVLDDYERILDLSKEERILYTVIPGLVCKTCHGVLLRKVSIFPTVTCGGNPEVGCPVCRTMSSGVMMMARKDFMRIEELEPQAENEKMKNEIVLKVFTAEWCSQCAMQEPYTCEVDAIFKGRIEVMEIDVDKNENKKESEKFGITAIPTIIIEQNGEVKNRRVGVTNTKTLCTDISALLGD